jgi:hypothetical protein
LKVTSLAPLSIPIPCFRYYFVNQRALRPPPNVVPAFTDILQREFEPHQFLVAQQQKGTNIWLKYSSAASASPGDAIPGSVADAPDPPDRPRTRRLAPGEPGGC